MRKICFIFTAALCFVFLLSGCGKNPKITQFKKDINTFCIDISNLDTAINGIDANTVTARTELLGYLDEIDQKFREFAELDFPEEYKYLEALADESSKYMTEAVIYFHKTFSEEESFNEAYSKAKQGLLTEVCNNLVSTLLEAVNVTRGIMNDAENSPQIRLNASQILFNTCIKLTEQTEVLQRIEKLERGCSD